MERIKIHINGKEVFVSKGEILLEVIKREGIDIPSLCYLKGKSYPKNPCGLCIVKLNGKEIVRSCEYKIEKKISVETDTEDIKNIRRKILENKVANHYGDCKAPCHIPCPGGLNIQGFIGLIAKGDFKGALALIKEKLPLPSCVGRVCPRFCESVCRRAFIDEPVAINNLKRFVADYCLKYGELPIEVPPLNGKKVAVIGAGPAGISCAYFLRLKGYNVTIFDKESEPGGLLRYGIPSYKLPREIVKKEIENILKLGIEFVGGKTWGKDFTLEDLKNKGYEAIFIAVGARKEKFFGFEGEEFAESGFKFLYKFNKYGIERERYLNKKIAILGISYTALELARVLRRLGCEVTIYYPRSKMEVTVPLREIGYAEKEGVKFIYVTAPLKLVKTSDGYKLTFVRTVLDGKRRLKFILETSFEENFDFVFRGWGEVSSDEFKNFGKLESLLELTSEGVIKVNPQTLKTNIDGVFAGGDFIYGSRTVIQAVASGRKAANSISAYLEGKKIKKSMITIKYDFSRGKRFEDFDINFLDFFIPEERSRLKERDPGERIKDFEEVLIGLTEDEAIKEANRCLRCGCLGIHKCEFREVLIKEGVDSTQARKKVKYIIKKDHPFIEVDLNKCIACEKCVRICSYSAIFFRVVNKGKPTEYITFRFLDSCVNCGDCVDVCPTGALIKKNLPIPYSREEAKAVKSVCGYCGVGCNLTVWVKNETILEITGKDVPPNYGSLCAKGRFGFEFYRSPERLKKPLIRKNLTEPFQEVPWDTALEFVAENLKFIRNKYGPQSLGFICSGRVSNEETYLLQKIARVIFKTNNIDNQARVCHAASAAGLNAIVGTGAPCASFDDILKTNLIFLIGANPFNAHPIIAQKIFKALESGANLIVADPLRIYFADFANIYLPIRPGSNIALLNGMAYVILKEELYDKEFIKKHVENFDTYRYYILNEWNLDKASKYTGLKSLLIEEAARLFAQSEKALILWGMGVTQHRTGTYTVMALANLTTLCGFWGKEGCGVIPLRGENNIQGSTDLGGLPYILPGYQNYLNKKIREKFQKVWGEEIPTTKGLTLPSMIKAVLNGELKALYIMGYELATSLGPLKAVWEALSKLEFLVVQDIFMTSTAKYAHVILPSACVFEKCGTFTNGERRVQLFEKAVSSPEEALPDWQILTKLAQKLGYNWGYSSPSEILEEIKKVWGAFKGINYERLLKKGIQWPCRSENHPGTSRFALEDFPKKKFHLAIIKSLSPVDNPSSKYPYIFITIRKYSHFNAGTMSRKSQSLKKLYPEPVVNINLEDAKKLKIYNGSTVRIWNDRGEILCKAYIDKRVPEGIVVGDFHFDTVPVNVLTGFGVDELVETPEYKVIAVAIEPAMA